MTTLIDFHRSDFNYAIPSTGSFGDILWRDDAGDTVLWLMTNNQLFGQFSSATLPFVSPGWHVKAAAEFDVPSGGANSDDILWQNDNGALVLWQMNGTAVSAISALPNPGPTWHIVGDNDFGGLSQDNILWQNDNGALAMWSGISTATGTVAGMLAGTQNPGPAWHVVGTGDTTGDGKAGLLWQNDNGALALWENPIFPEGAFTFNTLVALPRVDPSWHVKGMTELRGHGGADIVFQNDNGAVVVWEMSGTTITAMNLIDLNPGPSWHIAGMRDMDGDGKADILFQNDNGAAAVWEDYVSLGGTATFLTALPIIPNPNPNGHVWDLL